MPYSRIQVPKNKYVTYYRDVMDRLESVGKFQAKACRVCCYLTSSNPSIGPLMK